MSKRQFIGFSVLQVTYWCFHASFICFASAFFLDRGVGNTAVSLLLAGYLLFSFLGSIVWGAVCDAIGTNKKVFLFGLFVSAALMWLIYAFASDVRIMAFAYPLLGFFFLPQSANSEAWLLSACNHDPKVYGQIRSMPSLFYAVWAMIMGRLIDAQGYWVMLAGGTAFVLAVITAAILLPDAGGGRRKQPAKAEKGALRSLMEIGPYKRLIVLLFVIGLAVAPVNNMKIVVLQNVGGSVAHIGLDSFASAITQVPFFLFAGWLARIPLRTRYMAMALCPLVMILMCLFAASPAMVIGGSVLYNMGYGVLLPTMREVTERYVPENLRTLGHTLSDAVFSSLSGVVSLAYAGMLVDGLGVDVMIAVSAVIGFSALAISCLRGRNE